MAGKGSELEEIKPQEIRLRKVELQPPGAGLPIIELFVARAMFAVFRWRNQADNLRSMFQDEQAKILGLVDSVDSDVAATKVLIRRLPGLEDSSRNWSAFMTLAHLSLVNGAVLNAVRALSRGDVPSETASTADVKPSPDTDAKSVAEFRRVNAAFLKAVGRVDQLKTKVRYRHPWFGRLDAHGWYALAAWHMRLHRVQIERILAGVRV